MISIEQIKPLAERTANPFYIYSLSAIEERCRLVRSALPSDMQVYYSLKANSHPTLVDHVRRQGLSADVASLGELQIALAAGYLGREIEFTGPGKSSVELKHALENEVDRIVIESEQELEILETLASTAGKRISVCVRLNPKNRVNQMGRMVADEPSQFGIDEESGASFRKVLDRCKFVSVVGAHTHIQSQILAVGPALQNLRFAIEAALRFSTTAKVPLEFVNLGGGLGIPYSPDQAPINFPEFASGVKSLIETARVEPGLAKTRFGLEFGRFIVGEAGTFVTRVLYTKTSRGRKFVITDGGFTQSQIACGAGQVIRRNLPIHAYQQHRTTDRETVTIAGPSCYGQDILAQDVNLPTLQTGDLIGVQNVGAYGYSFSPFKFLRQREADEFFI